ncbi:hypothetical protein [Pseudodesulfovibrio piezophilus]|uniref:Glycosyltransferase n=1 Tax=Pseudodesulfovibrio piezophilus (strain DSM 21447 / JCM 15486 / C1TLV30) TaxID=1322246 RepID=M1WWS6_PSEP2|nr:hypothetical protein [Pseudodesulfovibrio piezophilus]CCH49298.1 protein of unknown function [Pseudodesulfovibrio piezophilus C1TLV30]
MTRSRGKSITVYVGFRPFAGEWLERNQTVLNALAWQGLDGLKVKFACWDDETATLDHAERHGYGTVITPWVHHYLFTGPQRSFKALFEACLTDCDTDLFIYINGDIILQPGILNWLAHHAEPASLYSMPRHNWEYTGLLDTPDQFETALAEAVPEEWTALDLFAMHTEEARQAFIPFPPFLLTAGSMDSWLVVRAGAAGWRRILIPPQTFHMLHIEHDFSHPLKPGASADKYAKWAFNCGIYAQATLDLPQAIRADSTLQVFEGAAEYARTKGLPTREYQNPEECIENTRQHEEIP